MLATMELLHSIFEWIELVIDVSAALVMVLAFVVAIFSYFRISLRSAQTERIVQLQVAKFERDTWCRCADDYVSGHKH